MKKYITLLLLILLNTTACNKLDKLEYNKHENKNCLYYCTPTKTTIDISFIKYLCLIP